MPKPVSALASTQTLLAAPLANSGTFTVPYPAGVVQADLTNSTGGQLALESGEVYTQAASQISLAFGASTITVTNSTGGALPAGRVYLSFGTVDINGSYNVTNPKKVQTGVN